AGVEESRLSKRIVHIPLHCRAVDVYECCDVEVGVLLDIEAFVQGAVVRSAAVAEDEGVDIDGGPDILDGGGADAGPAFFEDLPVFGVIEVVDGGGVFDDAAGEGVVFVAGQGAAAVFVRDEAVPGVVDQGVSGVVGR